jgi:hypothetical protein
MFIKSLTFSPDGKTLGTGLVDGTALVWDMGRVGEPLKDLQASDLDQVWADLASTDVPRAHAALWSLVAAPAPPLALLKERLRPSAAEDPKRIHQWIADLDSAEFVVRDKASGALEQLGVEAEPSLRQVLAGRPSLEVRKRVETLLAGVRIVRSPEMLRKVRAVQVLERIGSPVAREVLALLAKGAPAARDTQEAKRALERLARRPTAPP